MTHDMGTSRSRQDSRYAEGRGFCPSGFVLRTGVEPPVVYIRLPIGSQDDCLVIANLDERVGIFHSDYALKEKCMKDLNN